MALRPAVFDRDMAALNVAGFFQSLAKSSYQVFRTVSGSAVEKPDHRYRRLLRPRRKRPRNRCSAKKRDELAASHSITSSAATSKPGGTVRPIAFAVLRLTTVSNLVAACTGRSAGFSARPVRAAKAGPF